MQAQVLRALPQRTGELNFSALPDHHPIEHELALEHLEHFAGYKKRRQLERDFLYRRKRAEIDRVLDAFEWGHAIDTVPRHAPDTLRAVAWNIERGKRFDALSGRLADDVELGGADLLLLTEVDKGMGRSGNRNVARELAEQLGMSYVYANHHLVLVKGDSGEQEHNEPNTLSLHGSALLSRYPIRRAAAVSLSEHVDKFQVFEKRLGSKRALFAEVELPDGPLTVVVAHLDPFAPPRHRAAQMRTLLTALARFGGQRVLLGGDLNTNTYNLSNGPSLLLNIAYKLSRYGVQGTVEQYAIPEARYERKLFQHMHQVGLAIDGFNVPEPSGTLFYDGNDPELKEKALAYLPEPAFRKLYDLVEPWGGVVPLRLDWFAGYRLNPAHAAIIERPTWNDHPISDHSPIVTEVLLDGCDGPAIPAPPRRRPRIRRKRRPRKRT